MAQHCLYLYALGTVLLLTVIGCRNTSESVDSPESSEVPADFSLVLGEGGGFTGQWNGHTVQADGTVLQWNGPYAEANAVEVGTLSQEAVDSLWARVEALEVFEQELEERGNMTAILKVTGEGRSHRLSWIPGVPDLESPRTPIEAFYRDCRARLARFNP